MGWVLIKPVNLNSLPWAVPNTQTAGGNHPLTRSRDHRPVAVCILPRRAAQQPLGGNAACSEGLSIPA